VTASWDNTARLWDALSGKPISEPMWHGNTVTSVQFSPDGQRVVTASVNTAQLWDAVSGQPIGEPMRHGARVGSAQFSRDGQRVVTASVDDTARLWDAVSGQPIGEPMRHRDTVTSAQFSRDGQRVVTASEDKTARLWDARSGKPIGEPMWHGDTVTSVQFSPDGQRVVTASGDTARLWDFPTMSNKEDSAEDVLFLADWAEAAGGIALQEIQNALTAEQIQARRKKIANKFSRSYSELTPLQQFLKWSVSDPRNRAFSPCSQLTVAEWVEIRIKDGTLDGLRAAVEVDPTNARLAANFGLRLADHALKERIDRAEARRAEADFQTARS
jgi:WD40 repeat protein